MYSHFYELFLKNYLNNLVPKNGMFIRKKRVNNNEYAYLVKNEWTHHGARQKVSQYLGKVHVLIPQYSLSFEEFLKKIQLSYEEYCVSISSQQFIKHIIGYELYKHGFWYADSQVWHKDGLVVDLSAATVTKQATPIVLQLNNDFFCNHTLQSLTPFVPSQDEQQTAVMLAHAFVKAGIALDPTIFVEVYQKFHNNKI